MKELFEDYVPEQKPKFWDEEQKWPRDGKLYHTFKRDLNIQSFDHYRLKEHYTRLIERELVGYNVEVLEYVQIKMPSVQWKEGTKVVKEMDRYLVKVERDEWIRGPNPVLTRWQSFKLWLLRKPRPESPKPPRILRMYELGGLQFRIFRDIWLEAK